MMSGAIYKSPRFENASNGPWLRSPAGRAGVLDAGVNDPYESLVNDVSGLPTSIHAWLERVGRLDNEQIERLIPLLDAYDGVDAMRQLVRLCPYLADPARALEDWIQRPYDEVVKAVFQLRVVAGALVAYERGEQPQVASLAAWCCHELAEEVRTDADARERLIKWFVSIMADEDLAVCAQLQTLRQQNERGSSASDGGCVPHTIEKAAASRGE